MLPFTIPNCTVAFKLIARPFTDGEFLRIAKNGVNTEYNPRRFHGIILRMRYDGKRKVACLVFRSGRAVLTGVPHPDAANREAHRAKKYLQHAHGSPLTVLNLRVVNVVGTHSVAKTPLPINALTAQLKSDPNAHTIRYDTSIFPALRFKLALSTDRGDATCLIYHSGKVIVTGVTTIKDMTLTFSMLSEILTKLQQQ